ncbi:MAG: sugar phosphate nucleotidyltransferase [Leptospiraceae bacterium]|nr:sugar phosphate nucleotidyltransferase [Leptospiraceae bacterium]
MKGFILCGGFGTRMKELTKETPKPLLKISGKTLLEISLKFANYYGIKEFYINTHYLHEKLEKEVQNYSKVKIHISHEKYEILGTAGGIKTALYGKIPENEPFLVINPDSIFYPSPRFKLPNEFNSELLLYLAPDEKNSGNTPLALHNGFVSFENGGYYYIGLSIMNLRVLKDVPFGKYADLSDIYKSRSKRKELYGKIFPGYVLDVGNKEKYLQYLDIALPEYVNIPL